MAVLAVLLAARFHLDTAAVAVAVLGSLPALAVALAALPRVAEKPAYGLPVRQWDPVKLGVHRVIGGGERMPAYVRRPHDVVLDKMLDPAVAASRLVVIRGRSSTGKSAAAWHAVKRQLAGQRLSGWRLDYPPNPGALKERLDAGIPARTVLWLGELRQYADPDDADVAEKALSGLTDLLNSESRGRLIITTVWPEHWAAYTAAARAAGPGANRWPPARVAARTHPI